MAWIKKHYYWIIVAIVLFQLFSFGGLGNTFANIHVIPVTEDLGISRTQFSLPISLKGLFTTLGTFVSGFFLSRFGSKKTIAFGLLFISLTYFLLGLCLKQYALLFLYCGMVGLGGGLCGTSVATKVITSWFHKHRGFILGLATSATTLGGSLLGILQPMAMERFQTYKASFLLGAFLLLAAALLVIFFLKNTPEEMGLEPYGAGEEIIHRKKRIAEQAREGLAFEQMVRRPAFYLMIVCVLITCSTVYIASSVMVPHLMDRGLALSQATAVNSYKHLLISFFKLAVGALCDKIGAKKTVNLCLIFTSLGLVLYTMIGTALPFAYFAATIMAIGSPVVMVLPPLLAFSLFGTRAQAQYTGIFLGMVSLSSMVCTIASNFIFDQFGSYNLAFLIVAGLGLALVFLLYPLLFKLAEKDLDLADANKA